MSAEQEARWINEARTVYNGGQVTAAPTIDDQRNPFCRGLHLVIDITQLTATQTATFTIQGKDPLSGKYYTILASTALAAVATTVLKVYPGAPVSANVSANDILPRDWRVLVTLNNGLSLTFTVAALLVL